MSRHTWNTGWFSVFSTAIIVLAVRTISCIRSTEPSIPQLSVQPDTMGFPLDIGNKWYYTSPGRSQASSIAVKTIVDTGILGERLVRMTRLGQDSTLGSEIWMVIGKKPNSIYLFHRNFGVGLTNVWRWG